MREPLQHQEGVNFFVFVSVMLVSATAGMYMISDYFAALTIGAILAVLARPLYQRLIERGLKGRWAGLIVTSLIILCVVIPLGAFTTVAGRQGMQLARMIAKIDPEKIKASITTQANRIPFAFIHDNLEEIQNEIIEAFKGFGGSITSSVFDTATSIPGGFLQVFLVSLACFYFLTDGQRLVTWLRAKVPLDADVKDGIANSFRDTAISVVWASMAASVTQAFVMGIGYAVLGLPGAMIAAGATFVLAWVPLVGSAPVLLVGIGILAFEGHYTRVGIMVGIGLIAGTVDNVIRPMILNGRGEMHPLVSLLAIFGGLKMFGFFGVFFGPIIAAIILGLIDFWPVVGRRYGLRIGEE